MTELNDLNTARYSVGGAGVDTSAALAFGGEVPPIKANNEFWNGSSWTELNDLSTARRELTRTKCEWTRIWNI